MIVGVPRETFPGERRVAHGARGHSQPCESGHGSCRRSRRRQRSGLSGRGLRRQRRENSSRTRADVFGAADIVVQVLCYGSNDQTGKADVPLYRRNQVLIGFLRPLGSLETIQEIAAKGVTAFSVELMPRTTRAQSMDALSSMATICGYKAVLIAADTLPKIFPMLTTAAGTITPARVLIIGAGVAGLQAIATARRLGAVVSAYDLRPAVKEQVQSLGGRFVELADRSQRRAGCARLRQGAGRRFLPEAARIARKSRGGERRRDHGRGDPGKKIARFSSPRKWSRAWRRAR